MQTSAFEYKCRRCGEVYEEPFGRHHPPMFGNKGRVYVNASWSDHYGQHATVEPVQETNVHACHDSGHGISDLIGITPPREEGE